MGKISPWITLDASDARLRKNSELVGAGCCDRTICAMHATSHADHPCLPATGAETRDILGRAHVNI